MKNDNQEVFYKPIKKWLEAHNFRALVGGPKSKIVVPIGDVLPSRVHLVPDIIGVKDDVVVIVEVETNMNKLFEVMGKCMVWKTVAKLVYIAYPTEKCQKSEVFEKLGLGLLGVSEKKVEEIIKIMPEKSSDLFKILELHPLDHNKELYLADYLKKVTK